MFFFFFKQKTAYEMRISDWSSDVCSSDLLPDRPHGVYAITRHPMMWAFIIWALVHMALWGSTANLILSGGILALALFGSLGQDSKKKRLMGPDWVWWQRQTAYVPFVGPLAGRLRWRDALPGWAAFAKIGRASCRERVGQYG